MKVLVTGGNGFLAANTIRELNRRGFNVRAMVRSSSDLRSLANVDCELYYGNIVNIYDVLNAAKGCDIIIHTAANTSQFNMNYNHYVPVNITGTQNVLSAAAKGDIKKFIFVSTANAFGFGTKSNPGNEKRPARYPFTRSGYALSKINAQEMVLEYARNSDLDAVVVNPTFMIGPYDAKPSSGKIITMNYGKRTIFLPPGGKNFVHVADVATGICNAIDKGRKWECYLLANENLSYGEFYSKLRTICEKKQYQLKLPSHLVTTLGLMGTILGGAGIKNSLTRINSKILCIENYYSPAKAVEELGLPQTPVEQAITDAMEWFWENGYLNRH